MSTDIIGHKRQQEYLDNVLQRGRLAHAYLFHGPEHVGKTTVAMQVIRALVCGSAIRDGQRLLAHVCGACQDCRLIGQNAHPHVVFIDTTHSLTDTKEQRKEISIADIRELKWRFSFAASGALWRVAIVSEFEKMSDEAANAMLKMLEEPGDQTLFLLVTAHKDMIAPTIASRAQHIRFSLVPDGEMSDAFPGDTIRPEYRLIANGRPGILVRLLADSAYAEEAVAFLKEASRVFSARSIARALVFSDCVARDPEKRNKTFEYLIRGLRKEIITNPASPGAGRTVEKIKRIERIAGLVETTNVAPRLALDAAFVELMR